MKKNIKLSYLPIEDKSIEILTIGDFSDQTPVLVLLHEGLGSISMWKEIPKLIHEKTKLNILTYSRFGYGKSSITDLPRPLDYMTVEAEKYLPMILKKLSIRKHFLIGHSDGATIAALGSLKSMNNNLLGTVLIAPHFFVEQDNIIAIKNTTHQYKKGTLRTKLKKYHDNVDNAFLGWSNVWLNEEFSNWDITNLLSNIKIPIIGIQGLNDPYGSIAQLDILEKKLTVPFTKITIENCGHNPFHEHLDTTLEYINKFITKNL
jgi:pimeloyl-ACP methyl ester carboxylesterase